MPSQRGRHVVADVAASTTGPGTSTVNATNGHVMQQSHTPNNRDVRDTVMGGVTGRRLQRRLRPPSGPATAQTPGTLPFDSTFLPHGRLTGNTLVVGNLAS